MARYMQTVESATALGAGSTFANVVSAAGAGFKLRRIILGCRAGNTTPTSQQLTVALFRATARGTQTTNVGGVSMDPNAPASAITGVDTAWSVNPTLAASALARFSFNTQGGIDVPFEFLEELVCPVGTASGLALQNIGNALPVAHLITATLEWEE